MSEVVSLVWPGAAGMALGLFFFGGLWLTIRCLPTARHPVLLTLGSLGVRMAVALAGFFLVMAGRWERLLACVVGFIVMRWVLLAWLRPEEAPPLQSQTKGT